MAVSSTRQRSLEPLRDAAKVDAILAAISALDLDDIQKLGGWGPLEEISAATIFDGIEGSPSGVFAAGGNAFEVSCTVYVTLQYGGKHDGAALSDSYPAVVRGVLNDGSPEIQAIEVDNRSFYA
jgi:hypothetical protein